MSFACAAHRAVVDGDTKSAAIAEKKRKMYEKVVTWSSHVGMRIPSTMRVACGSPCASRSYPRSR